MLHIAGGRGTGTRPSRREESSGYLFFDVQLDPTSVIPKSLEHHFTIDDRQRRGEDRHRSEYEASVTVSVHNKAKAVTVIEPPLRGYRAGSPATVACQPKSTRIVCEPLRSIDGTATGAPERFAIDFVQPAPEQLVGAGRRPRRTRASATTATTSNSVAPRHGESRSRTDPAHGSCLASWPQGQTVQTAGGGTTSWCEHRPRPVRAFYATHAQPGSPNVKVG